MLNWHNNFNFAAVVLVAYTSCSVIKFKTDFQSLISAEISR